MSLTKRTYVDGETVITAENLNDIQDEIIQNASDISTKGTYSKPSGGIPSTDMTTEVQTSLGKADTAYQKPSGGIPATDLASAVQTSLGKADTALQSSDIDNTLTVSGKAADAKKTGGEISDVRNTLNHKADLIYDTASGDIASFPDGADGLPVKDLTVSIEPVQDTSGGDPSPTHICPISGWTGCNVTRTGRNLLPKVASKTELGVSFTVDDDGVVTMSGTTSAGGRVFLWQGELVIKENCILSIGTSAPNFNFNMGVSGDNNAILVNNGTGIASVPPGKYTSVSVYVGAAGTQYNVKMYPMLRLASDSDTTFVKYQGTTIPISWQSSAGTVYGGTLDVTTGTLTVDYALYTIDENQGFTNRISNQGRVYFELPAMASGYWLTDEKCVCDKLVKKNTENNPDQPLGITIGVNNDFVYIGGVTNIEGVTDLASFKTWLASNNITFTYKLATPQTYQLDPVTVNTLLGQNNIWADCGPSTVEYPCDTKLYIQKINAPTDDDMIADANIASGKYFIINNNLYLSTTAILAGDPIKPGTNCTLTNLAAALNAINT